MRPRSVPGPTEEKVLHRLNMKLLARGGGIQEERNDCQVILGTGPYVLGALGMWHHFVRKRARLAPLRKFSLCPPWHQHASKAD